MKNRNALSVIQAKTTTGRPKKLTFAEFVEIFGKMKKTELPNRYVFININGKFIAEHIHVAKTQIGKIPKGYVVNHKNGIKRDNRVENLEIVTYSENTKHAWRTGLIRYPDYYKGMNLLFCPKVGCGYKTDSRKYCYFHKNKKTIKLKYPYKDKRVYVEKN